MTLPAITTDQMREVDRIMIDDLGIELIQMMENAGHRLAAVVVDRFTPKTVTVLAGPGGNGGGGLAAARHLANRGSDVTVTLARPLDDLAPVPRHQADILDRMDVRFTADPPESEAVVDALIGYSLRGDPRGRTAELIEWANRQPSPVVSLDTPSGLDTTSGRTGEPCVVADVTVTLALPKRGLLAAPEKVGDLVVADISVPPSVYRAFGLEIDDPFGSNGLVELA